MEFRFERSDLGKNEITKIYQSNDIMVIKGTEVVVPKLVEVK